MIFFIYSLNVEFYIFQLLRPKMNLYITPLLLSYLTFILSSNPFTSNYYLYRNTTFFLYKLFYFKSASSLVCINAISIGYGINRSLTPSSYSQFNNWNDRFKTRLCLFFFSLLFGRTKEPKQLNKIRISLEESLPDFKSYNKAAVITAFYILLKSN